MYDSQISGMVAKIFHSGAITRAQTNDVTVALVAYWNAGEGEGHVARDAGSTQSKNREG